MGKLMHFLQKSSKKQLLWLTLLWGMGMLLLVLAMTDLFTESFVQGKYLMIYIIMIGSFVSVLRFYKIHYNNLEKVHVKK